MVPPRTSVSCDQTTSTAVTASRNGYVARGSTNKTVAWERVCRPQRCGVVHTPRFADGMGTCPSSLGADVVHNHSSTRGARAHGLRVRVTHRQAVGRAGHDADSTVTALLRTFVTSSVTIHGIDFARCVCVVDKEICGLGVDDVPEPSASQPTMTCPTD